MTYTTWDIESTVHPYMKRKASPFLAKNYCVTHGLKHKGDTKVTEYRFGRQRPGPGWLKPVLVDTKLLIGMNIKFDLLHALQDNENLDAWMTYIVDGGQVWDIQLAEYLLEGLGQKDQMLSMDEIAPRYGGNVKVDEVKALWNAGVMTEDIDPELLTRYLCGGEDEHGQYQLGDVENTEKIALAQVKRAREAGQLDSILLNMGALVFTVEAERNGMFVDKATGLQIAAELKTEVERLTAALVEYLPADLPFDFNWNSTKQKSALFFGGTVYWDGYEYDLAGGPPAAYGGPAGQYTIFKHEYDALPHDERPKLKYAQKTETHYVLTNGKTMACAWWEHCADTEGATDPHWHDRNERVRFAGGKNAGECKTKQVKVNDITKPKGRTCKVPYTFARITEPEAEWKAADEGLWSTSSEVIEELGKREIPFLKFFASLQSMAKDLGTYYIGVDKEGNPTGMLTLVDGYGIIHHMLNMCSTVTARLSSSNPNLQNIPKGNKSDVKTLFVSRFGCWITDDFGDLVWVPEGKLIQSDFSSLEVYVQAILTKCKRLIEDLQAGLDLHCVRLAAKEHMEYEAVLKLAKGYTDADGNKVEAVKEWDYKRTGAKVYSFQRAFGAGIKKIARETGMTEDETQALADAEDERYPEIPVYYQRITETIKGNRVPKHMVPHPEVPGVMCSLGTSSFRTPDGKVYSYKEQPAPAYLVKRGTAASFSPTEIRNYVVQGTGGEWAKAAMWLAVREFYRQRNWAGLGLLVNQVHDAVYADADDTVAFEVAATLHACMESASEWMEWKFKWHIPVPVPSDTSWGRSMMDEESIPGLKERAAVIRKELRTRYMGGYVPSFDKEQING